MKKTDADNTARKQRGKPFEQGESGNPSGRPRGSRNKTTLAVQSLLEGEAEEIGRKAIELAKQGDMTAIRLILERVLPPRKDAPVTFDIPRAGTPEEVSAAMDALIQAVASGELTPGEGQSIAALLEEQRKCLETTLLSKRLDALQTVLLERKGR